MRLRGSDLRASNMDRPAECSWRAVYMPDDRKRNWSADKDDLIFAIATPAVQAVAGVTIRFRFFRRRY